MLNFALPLLSIGRKIGWRGFLIIGIACTLFYLWNKGNRLQEENENLKSELVGRKAELETIQVVGEYPEPDTIWDSIPVPYVVYDTISGDSVTLYKKIPWFKIFGYIEIDTTKKFAPELNSLSVHVKGHFWYPEEYGDRSWMTIAPYLPVERRSKTWSIGLTAAISSHQRLYGGASVAINRASVFGLRSFSGPEWVFGIQYKLLTF